ncbi:MAG TPA: HAD-IIA family hydrolase [Pseudonocardia sp.]|nr:HAD-IIA family hydrolase [Pseudonocardia sp.]
MTAPRERYDALLFDLDGTLFRGGTALPGAPEALAEAAGLGCRIGYLTNNGSRNAGQVVEHLRALGFAADESEVVTSGQAAARLLADRLKPGDAVLVVGSKALAGEVTSVGLTIADRAEQAGAVVQGHSPDTGWRDLAEACLAIRAGAVWVATNVDATLPDERGELPGNGSMVAALVTATESEPLVAGKPEAALFDEAVRRAGAQRPLMVGDRLETDIAGANAVRMPSLLVLTGVSDAAALLAAPEAHRPTYLGADLTALRTDLDRLRPTARPPWRASRAGDELRLELDPDAGPGLAEAADPIDALRTLCAAHWAEGGGRPARLTAAGPTSVAALHTLGLTADR